MSDGAPPEGAARDPVLVPNESIGPRALRGLPRHVGGTRNPAALPHHGARVLVRAVAIDEGKRATIALTTLVTSEHLPPWNPSHPSSRTRLPLPRLLKPSRNTS